MKLIQRVIYTGFAAIAITSASMPVWPAGAIHDRSYLQGPDFAWYASVGRPAYIATTVTAQPAPREGWIWSPQHWEWNGREHVWVEGHWVRDDYAEQVAIFNLGVPATMLAEAPPPAIVFERR
ncbi:MAG TPA: YXWGXW repeat-containing protein [Usitatibacter sp.]|nr:YXWGXW repeat-containing protein [Usitatibacter sp.]